ncbi:MAG: AsmA-like C-terminal region-containing protein, partial [Alphaproteobacteria bacterium]|nr:AsmA-like C-terminal region-containing protein [Alphaproteobacteria bacterium]
ERIDAIQLAGSAGSLRGPFQFKGTARPRQVPLSFETALDVLNGGKPVGLRLTLGLIGTEARLGFTGRLSGIDAAPKLHGQLTVSAQDLAAVQGIALPSGRAPDLLRQSLELKAALDASAQAVGLNDITLRLGETRASGAVSVGLGEQPSIDLALAIGRLNLDRLMPADAGEGAAPASKGGGDAAKAAAGTGFALPTLPANLRGSVAVTIDGLGYRGGVVSQMQLDASARDGQLRLDRLSALLPGGSDLRLSGQSATVEGGPRFDGKLDMASDNLRGLLQWLGADPAMVPAGRLANMVLTSNFMLTGAQLQVTDLNLRLDNTAISGAGTYLLQARPSFGVALSVDRVNLDGYLPAAAAASGKNADAAGPAKSKATATAAGSLALLEEFDGNLNLRVGELTYNAAPVRGIAAELSLVGGKLTVRRATVQDLAGAGLALSGSGEGFAAAPSGRAKLQVKANSLAGLVRLAGVDLGIPAKRLTGLSLDADLKGDAKRLELALRGGLAGGKFALSGAASNLTAAPAADLRLDLDHPSLAKLAKLLDLGLAPSAKADTPIAVRATAKGDLAALTLDASANLAGARLNGSGKIANIETAPRLDLKVAAKHADLAGLMRALGADYRPAKRDLGGLELSTRLTGGGDGYEFAALKGKVGSAEFSGAGGIRLDGTRPRLSADISAGQLIVDHFLAAAGAGGKGAGGGGGGGRGGRDGRWSRQPIDLSPLQSLDADIRLAAKQLMFQKYPFMAPRLHLLVDDGLLTIKELSGRLFDGQVGLAATVRSRPLPALGLSVRLTGADINKAMRTALEMDQVTGKLDFTGQFQSRGGNQWDLVNALQGEATVKAVDGVVRGFDMKNFSARLGRLNKAPDFLDLVQRAFSGGQTSYSSAQGVWKIRDGVATTKDMRAQLDASEAILKGNVHLPDWSLDLRGVLRLTEHDNAPDLGVHLFGPLDQPRHDLKTKQLERWLLARLGRELLGDKLKGKGGDVGKLLDVITGGKGAARQPSAAPTPVQPSQPQPSQPAQPAQPSQQTSPEQQLLKGLFKVLRK